MLKLISLALIALVLPGLVHAEFELELTVAGSGRQSLAPGTVSLKLQDETLVAQRAVLSGKITATVALSSGRISVTSPGGIERPLNIDQATDSQISIASDRVTATLTPAGTSRQILGYRCSGYEVAVSVFDPDPRVREPAASVRGRIWIAKTAPGQAAWAAAIQALSGQGLFLSSPAQVLREPERERALMLALLATTQAGLPLEGQLQVQQTGRSLGSSLSASLTETITFRVAQSVASSD